MKSLTRCFFVTTLLLCSTSAFGQDGPFSESFVPPTEFKTERVHLKPLAPEFAELDFEAASLSREHLRSTLHWGNWPSDDMTVDDNRNDLKRHWKEFENREAYAYTVLAPDGERCVGCVYINPMDGKPRAASMAYWVVADELQHDLDQHLIKSVLDWIENDWPLDNIVMPLHTNNERGVKIAIEFGLRPAGPPKNDMVRYVWQRNS